MGLRAQGCTKEEQGIPHQDNTTKVKVFSCGMLVKNGHFLITDLVTFSNTALFMLSPMYCSPMSMLLGIISKIPEEVCCSGAWVVSVCYHATCFSICKEQQICMCLYEWKLVTCCKNFVWGFSLTSLYGRSNLPCIMCSVHVIIRQNAKERF